MEAKYVEAIKAGIIGGVILAAIELVFRLISLLGVINFKDISPDMSPEAAIGIGMGAIALCCCVFILYILILAGTGALAVRLTNILLRDLNDAVIVSGIAGAIAGLIWGIVNLVLSILSSFMNIGDGAISGTSTSFGSAVCSTCCCLPFEIVIGVVIAIIGGAIYWAVIMKR